MLDLQCKSFICLFRLALHVKVELQPSTSHSSLGAPWAIRMWSLRSYNLYWRFPHSSHFIPLPNACFTHICSLRGWLWLELEPVVSVVWEVASVLPDNIPRQRDVPLHTLQLQPGLSHRLPVNIYTLEAANYKQHYTFWIILAGKNKVWWTQI